MPKNHPPALHPKSQNSLTTPKNTSTNKPLVNITKIQITLKSKLIIQRDFIWGKIKNFVGLSVKHPVQINLLDLMLIIQNIKLQKLNFQEKSLFEKTKIINWIFYFFVKFKYFKIRKMKNANKKF
jgi:hypothetical protein